MRCALAIRSTFGKYLNTFIRNGWWYGKRQFWKWRKTTMQFSRMRMCAKVNSLELLSISLTHDIHNLSIYDFQALRLCAFVCVCVCRLTLIEKKRRNPFYIAKIDVIFMFIARLIDRFLLLIRKHFSSLYLSNGCTLANPRRKMKKKRRISS